MSPNYSITKPESLLSPSLVIFREHLIHNIDAMIKLAGGPERLRPHCKTHKMAAVTKLMLDRGITKHKAATIAEAEMLAQCGVKDIVISYNMVGPNIARAIDLAKAYPDARITVAADDAGCIEQLGAAAIQAGVTIGVVLDVNPGRDRTGVVPGPAAAALYKQIAHTSGLRAEGLHLYDGQQIQADPVERKHAVDQVWERVVAFRELLERNGLPVPRIICGGTPTFPVYAQMTDSVIELSPGTCVFHDKSYGEKYCDLSPFVPAAVVFTRVVSRPTPNRVTLDVGTKAVASDPPMGQRVVLPAIADGVQVLHNEEHLVVETPDSGKWKVGEWTLAIPRHVCPTSALHRAAYVIENGQLVDEWEVTSRDRKLTI
jgi:D-serine deaminase-like pyridoxal phosphate-dependent protein